MSNFITATPREKKRKAPEPTIPRARLKKSKTTMDLASFFQNTGN
jgi:hypothetical protein